MESRRDSMVDRERVYTESKGAATEQTTIQLSSRLSVVGYILEPHVRYIARLSL